jgi:cytochrome c-type biogenesis protein CcmF
MANMTVMEDGREIDTLKPEKRFYKKPEQPTTEVAIRSTLGSDLYIVLGSYDSETRMATFLAYLNPLIAFLWIGGVVFTLGTAVVIWPARSAVRVPAADALAEEVSR